MDTVIRAWPRHLHEIRMCTSGARLIAERNGIDYSSFVMRGTPIDELRATGNEFCILLANQAEQEALNNGR